MENVYGSRINRFRNEKYMNFKMISRKTKYIIYLKKADQIATFLTSATVRIIKIIEGNVHRDKISINSLIGICHLTFFLRRKNSL